MKPVLRTSFYKGRKVLVTGGASFIGSHLCELLVNSGAVVTVADDLSSGKLENLKAIQSDITFKKVNLLNPAATAEACTGQSVVFHLAAAHGGRGFIETHPVACIGNTVLDHTVFQACATAGVKKIVFASSACVYPVNLQADSLNRGLLEESSANFSEPGAAFADGEYGWAKLIGEMQLKAFYKEYGISGIACRIFTAYGERENESHAAIALIAKAAARLDPFPIWGDGLQTRNFTYVGDTVLGLALAGEKLSGFATINVGTSRHYTILEMIEEIFANLKWRPKTILKQLDKPVGVKSRASNNAYARQVLEWEPGVTLRDGLTNTIAWFQQEHPTVDPSALEDKLMERRIIDMKLSRIDRKAS